MTDALQIRPACADDVNHIYDILEVHVPLQHKIPQNGSYVFDGKVRELPRYLSLHLETTSKDS